MAELIAWCAFLGGWLLFAGPVFQAALELREEGVQRERIEQARSEFEDRSPRVSPWWWLLPPVHYVLSRRRSRAYRRALTDSLTPAELAGLASFLNKATGWMLVAGGAALIAVKETWELAETYHWPHAVFWVLIVVMALACALNTALRIHRTRGFVAGPARGLAPGG